VGGEGGGKTSKRAMGGEEESECDRGNRDVNTITREKCKTLCPARKTPVLASLLVGDLRGQANVCTFMICLTSTDL